MMLTFSRGVFFFFIIISKELKEFLELWINWQACGIWKWEPVLGHSCLAGISWGQALSLYLTPQVPAPLSSPVEEL